MSIEELKQIEDLKRELGELRKKYYSQIESIIRKKVDESFAEFKKYFSDKGFTVKESEKAQSGFVAKAEYGALVVTLERGSFERKDRPWGVDFRFEFYVALPHKKQYYIILNRGIPSISFVNGDTVSGLQKQIDQARNDLENFGGEKWIYFLMQEGQKHIGNIYGSVPQFASMLELLQDIAK